MNSLLDKQVQSEAKNFNFKLDFSDPTKLTNYSDIAKNQKIAELEGSIRSIKDIMIKHYLNISPETEMSNDKS